MNWSFILKHLLSTSSKLKKQLQRERQQQATLARVSGVENQRDNTNSPLKRNNNGTDAMSPLDRVQIRMVQMKSAVEEDKRRDGQQGKLGPRLASNQHALNVNKASAVDAIEEIDQLGPPEDDDEIDQLDQIEPEPKFLPFREKRTGRTPSSFAQEVATSLNVESKEAAVAMDVVDTVSNMTLEQLRTLSPGTRAQVMEIRKELGLDNFQQIESRGRNPSSRSSTPQSVGSSNRFFTPQQGYSNQKGTTKRASSAERNSTYSKSPGRLPHSNSASDLRDLRNRSENRHEKNRSTPLIIPKSNR